MQLPIAQRLRAVRALLFLGASLCVTAPVASAQSSDTNRVAAGDTVRVRMDRGLTVEAVFQRWEGESMALSVEGLTAPWIVSVFDMQALDVYTDRTRREGFRHGALLGAAEGSSSLANMATHCDELRFGLSRILLSNSYDS